MDRRKICIVVGTRPEIIKMSPILKEIKLRNHDLVFVHTGQHHDFLMSEIFFKELEVPKVNNFLNVGTTSQAIQIGETIINCEKILLNEKPDIVLVQGDTNSAVAASLISSKLNIPIGHIEAGCRSFDKKMSEENNRVIISDIAYLNFAPTQNCVNNLIHEGIKAENIFLTGHPICDLLNEKESNISNKILMDLGIKPREFHLLTLHRRENIEQKDKIKEILLALNKIANESKIIFPCHPHTQKQIEKFGLNEIIQNVKIIPPIGYFESLSLIKNARIAFTDSGGIQQEAAILRTPCITLREVTEWIETVESGTNFLVGSRFEKILMQYYYIEDNYAKILNKFKDKNLFGEGFISGKILNIIESKL